MAGRSTSRRPRAEVLSHLNAITPREVLQQALDLPGEWAGTYTRFMPLSVGNQALLAFQGLNEPYNIFKRWKDMDRHVKKGEGAYWIRRPWFKKEAAKDGSEQEVFGGFTWSKCIFGVSQTEGEELPPYETPEWSELVAADKLNVTEVPFTGMDGNMQGWSIGRTFSINPVAVNPLKTKVHEWAHILDGHTTPEGLAEYQTHRGVKEFIAEGTAYITMRRIGAEALYNAPESRKYIEHHLQGETPPESAMGAVLRSSDKIYNAG